MKYKDAEAGLYKEVFPILKLGDTILDDKLVLNNLDNLLGKCLWYKHSSVRERELIGSRFKNLHGINDLIIKVFKIYYPTLNIKHILIGGSYLFKGRLANDIDFNIIVSGSFFDYKDIYDISMINKRLESPVNKISFMVFGEDDFLYQTGINDVIETFDYVHSSLCMREGVIFNLRNITIYGYL